MEFFTHYRYRIRKYLGGVANTALFLAYDSLKDCEVMLTLVVFSYPKQDPIKQQFFCYYEKLVS